MKIGHVQVQVAVDIDVSQGHRHASGDRGQAGLLGNFDKLKVAVITKQPRPTTKCIHQQVETPVAVNIREGRGG